MTVKPSEPEQDLPTRNGFRCSRLRQSTPGARVRFDAGAIMRSTGSETGMMVQPSSPSLSLPARVGAPGSKRAWPLSCYDQAITR